jgi:Gluconate 2-dehydrogenase subunit 3
MNASSETEQERLINRREAIRRVSALLGGVAFVGGSALLAAAEKAGSHLEGIPGEFSAEQIALLDEIAETILPQTKTPGAKAAKTGAFMARMVTDCYSPAQQKVFREGMLRLDDAIKKANQVSFMAATAEQRLALLTALDLEQNRVMEARDAANRKRLGLAPLPGAPVPAPEADINAPAHYFRMMKELSLLGFFTSEVGCTQALRYIEVPGRFDPCLPYAPGESAWAAHA